MWREVKVLLVVLILLSAYGCASIRKKTAADINVLPTVANYNAIVNSIKEYNITDDGFIIRKGRIELKGTNADGSYNFNARVNNEGDFSASVKGPLGIEVLRIIAVGNDICVIDRLGKIAYVGKKDTYMKKNGVPEDFIRTLFGDMPDLEFKETDTVIGKTLIFREENENFAKETGICIDEMKVCSERYSSFLSESDLTFNYGNFRISGENKYASEITMTENNRKLMIILNIVEMTVGFSEEIQFSVPSYKRRSI